MIKDLIPNLEHEDLVKLKKDLDAGGIHIKKMIDTQIKENEKKHESYCTTCFAKIDPEKRNNYTLVFGPDDFRKKASFCAVDCLEYFIQRLKELERKNNEK
jgi:hypothetical protein